MGASYSPNPFNELPIETTQNIATFLPHDKDICNFRLVCQSALDAVDGDNFFFWRRRFVSIYEPPTTQISNHTLKKVYQQRRVWLRNGAAFKAGKTGKEEACLEVLRDLVVDSFSEKTKDKPTRESANLEHVKRFLNTNNILQCIFKSMSVSRSRRSAGHYHLAFRLEDAQPSLSSLLETLQVISAPMLLSFEPHILKHIYGYHDSQVAVYSTENFFTGSSGLDVNMHLILHNINYWRHHMVKEEEQTLYYAFSSLSEDEHPKWWSAPLKQGVQKLGSHWKGSYAFVNRDEIEDIRDHRYEGGILDNFGNPNEAVSFQDMRFELTDSDTAASKWPRVFEKHLRSLTPPASRGPRTRSQKRSATSETTSQVKSRSFHFEGEGQHYNDDFFATGWLNQLPPQNGIPGWQRLTMMKYFEDDFGVVDIDGLWAYEGVVLPGGQIVVGRWWYPDDTVEEMYSGPFILWCVD